MDKKLLVVLSTLALAACQSALKIDTAKDTATIPENFKLVSSNNNVGEGIGIAYKKYEMDNGLTVILHEDKSDPLVHVDVTYHVGSAREELGKSGFAHFFEHMMFQGSENVADEQHFKLVTEAGGRMNGTTNSDRTNYYQTVPANQLERILWLEADRMGFLLNAVTQEKFEVQRETVKNERAQRVDNQPYGLRSERTSEALYPSGHPYSWPVIGYVEDLDRVGVDDLKAFFQTWYGPNNAVITIGGDFDEQQTLQWLNKYFATIPRGPAVERQAKQPVTLDEDRYLTLEDDVHLPLLQLTFPTVHARHKDEAALDVLADILGGGKTSLFYKNMVKDGFAVQAVVQHPCRELACQFELISLPNPQKVMQLADLEKIVRDTLEEFETRGVQPDDLVRTKAGIRSSTILGLQSVSGKVSSLAYNEIFSDEPDMFQFDNERYENVTAEDVMAAYNKYIKGKGSVVLSIVPRGANAIAAKPSNFELAARDIPAQSESTFTAPADIVDNFDRSQIPSLPANPTVKVPDYWQTTFDNGIKVLGHYSPEVPVVTVVLNLEGGPLLDSKETAGLAAMTAAMMQESTENYSTEELSNALQKLGSSVSFSAGGRFTSVQVVSLVENIDATFALMQEMLLRPAFQDADFQRLKQRTIQSLQQAEKRPQYLSNRAQLEVLYGTENRIGLADGGTLETISNLQLEDVKQFYKTYYTAHMASAIVVGKLDQKQTLKKLAFLDKWRSNTYEIAPYQDFPDLSSPKIYFVNDPDAAQTIVSFIKPSLPYDVDGEYFRNNLMNFPLGGMFNSRINLNLREDKGYTYGARTGFGGGKTLGRFTAQASVNKESTIASIQEFVKEISQYQEAGITPDELEFMRKAYTQGDALKFETPFNKASFLRQINVYGLDKDFPTRQNDIIKSISKQEIDALAKKHLELNEMQLVLVGDWAYLETDMQALAQELGRPIVMME